MCRQFINWGRLFIFYALLLLLIAIDACKKLDFREKAGIVPVNPIEKFFEMPSHTHPTVKRIASVIKKQNDQNHFLPRFIRDQGFILWDKAKMFVQPSVIEARLGGGGGSDSSWILPLVKENTERISGFLACLPKGGDTILFRLFDASTYLYHYGDTDSSGIEALELALITMSLEQEIFGHDIFKILDTALLNDAHGNAVRYIKLQEPSGRLALLGTWYVCYTVWVVDNEGQVVGCPPNDETCNQGQSQLICETFNVWGFDDLDEGHGGGSGQGGWGTGSGGDINGGWTNPCREIETIPGTFTGCSSGGPLGWLYYDFGDEENWTPYEYDQIGVAQNLRDSFPCAAALIEDSLFDINGIAQLMTWDHFTVKLKSHLYFKVDWNLNCNSQFNAYTNPFPTVTLNGGVRHLTDTIYLNPCFLKHGSKEMMVAVLLHESIHAYLYWCFKEYSYASPLGSGQVDSTYLKEHFPLHWRYLVAPNFTFTENAHELIANYYLKDLKNLIFRFTNRNVPVDLRHWIAKMLAGHGLQKTSTWGKIPNLSDTCHIHAVSYWGRYDHYPVNPPYVLPCGTYTTSFRDSLQMLRGDSCQ